MYFFTFYLYVFILGMESPHVGAGKSPYCGRKVPVLGQESPRIGQWRN